MGDNAFSVSAMAAVQQQQPARPATAEKPPGLEVTDAGDWVDNVFYSSKPSSLLSRIIGRRSVSIPLIKSTFTSADIAFDGYLLKQGSWRKNWKRRYFVIRKDIRMLLYFSSKENLSLLGSVALDAGTQVWAVPASQVEGQPFCFGVKNSAGEMLLLQAHNRVTMETWMQCLLHEATRPQEVATNWWQELFRNAQRVDGISHLAPLLKAQADGEIVEPVSPRLSDPDEEGIRQMSEMLDIRESVSIVNINGNDNYCTPRLGFIDENVPVIHEEGEVADEEDGGGCREGEGGEKGRGGGSSTGAASKECAILAALKAEHRNNAHKEDDEGEEFPQTDDEDESSTQTKSTDEASQDVLSLREQAQAAFTPGSPPAGSLSRAEKRSRTVSVPNLPDNAPSLAHIKGVVSDITNDKQASTALRHRTPPNSRLGSPEAPSLSNQTSTDSYSSQSASTIRQLQAFIEFEGAKTMAQSFFLVMYASTTTKGSASNRRGRTFSRSGTDRTRTPQRSQSVDSPSGHARIEWVEMGRTEVIRTDADLNQCTSNKFQAAFSVPFPHPCALKAGYLMFQLYRLDNRTNELTKSELVAHCVIPTFSFQAPVILSEMEVVSRAIVDISEPELVEKEIDNVTVGLVTLRSDRFHQLGRKTRNLLACLPYAESLYAFPSMVGQVFCMEQLYVSKYTISVARAMVHLVMQERIPVVQDLIQHVNGELMAAYDAIQSFSEGTTGDPRMAGASNMVHDVSARSLLWGDDNTFETDSLLFRAVTKMEGLRKAKADLQRVQEILEDKYQACLDHCDRCARGKLPKGKKKGKKETKVNVIPIEQGGAFLRRSVWKKSSVWQFCPTNLNIQWLFAHPLQYRELAAGDSETIYRSKTPSDAEVANAAAAAIAADSAAGAPVVAEAATDDAGPAAAAAAAAAATEGSSPMAAAKDLDNSSESSELAESDEAGPHASLSMFPSITFGCMAAHPLGFNEGGLRRLLPQPGKKSGFTQQELLKLIQTTGGLTSSVIQKLKDEPQVGDLLLQTPVDVDATAAIVRSKVRLFTLAERIDTVGSQALGVAAASLHALIITAACGSRKHQEILSYALEAGFLVSVESLLSTQGHELGMLEDMAAALDWLSTCHVRLVRRNPTPPQPQQQQEQSESQAAAATNAADEESKSVHHQARFIGQGGSVWLRRDDGGGIVMDLELNELEVNTVMAALANSSTRNCQASQRPVNALPLLEDDPYSAYSEVIATIPLTGVMFSQGINEMQTLSNMSFSGESASQREMNMENFARLKYYTDVYRSVVRSRQSGGIITSTQARARLEKLDAMMAEVEQTIRREASTGGKNVNVLIKTSFLCRELAGINAICCKSGKDRTSMAVTLEQAKHLVETHHANDGKNMCRLLRSHGVRRNNVYANTAQRQYAFNQLQIQCIPKAYRPPNGTFSGKVAT